MNITVKVPDSLGQRAKHFAVDEQKSLSSIVVEMLEERLAKAEKQQQSEKARERKAFVQELRSSRKSIAEEVGGTVDVKALIEDGRRL